MGFFSLLERRVRQADSLLCVGLDPHINDLAQPTAQAAEDFCLRLIEQTADLAAAFKPNAAFFEVLGPQGWAVLRQVIAAVPQGIPVILDAKRGDIASTAQAYARSAFDELGAGAITLNPYLGYDAIEPFISDPQRGIFLLCKTSNPGAADLQELHVWSEIETGAFSAAAGRSPGSGYAALYEVVARKARDWNRQDNLGLVVGATQPLALRQARLAAPDLWLLAPGVGAQGGDLKAALQNGLRPDGLGMLLPVSRGISQSADVRKAAQALRDEINRQREAFVRNLPAATLPEQKAVPFPSHLADGLLQAGCIEFGQFTLKSGLQSPIYIDLRRLVSFPGLLSEVAAAYLPLLGRLVFDRMAALPYAALPIATAISLQSGIPLIYPRKEMKSYGTREEIEGMFKPGERAVVIDDLATTGGSKFEAIEKLVAAGLAVKDVVVLVDRQSGASRALEEAGFHMHAVFTLSQLLDYWENSASVPAVQITAVREFLSS